MAATGDQIKSILTLFRRKMESILGFGAKKMIVLSKNAEGNPTLLSYQEGDGSEIKRVEITYDVDGDLSEVKQID